MYKRRTGTEYNCSRVMYFKTTFWKSLFENSHLEKFKNSYLSTPRLFYLLDVFYLAKEDFHKKEISIDRYWYHTKPHHTRGLLTNPDTPTKGKNSSGRFPWEWLQTKPRGIARPPSVHSGNVFRVTICKFQKTIVQWE